MIKQLTLEDALTTARHFGGRTFDPALDGERLTGQLNRVQAFMSDGQWHTIEQIHKHCGGSENGISARLRDLRKPQFGQHIVERRRIKGGLFEYRMQVTA